MKKLLLILALSLFGSTCFAQNQTAILADFRRLVGEPDSTGSVSGAVARTWLNLGLREFANYGAFMRETTYLVSAMRDTVLLPLDFLYPRSVKKTLYDRPAPRWKSWKIELSDTGIQTIQRLDTIVLSTVRPDTLLDSTRTDIIKINYCYKKAATEKAIRPLVQVSPDSLEFFGRALLTRSLPPEYLSERLDTIIPSVTQPINALRTDVFEVRAAYRKELGTGKLLPLIRVPAESLSRIANTASDYYYFSGQPSPRIVFGQKKTFADTVYAEVFVASDFFTFISHPYPRFIMGKTPTTADTCFCQTTALLPNYSFSDTGKIATGGVGRMYFYPPFTRTDTVYLQYFATLDTLISKEDTLTAFASPLRALEINVKGALLDYMAERYYDRKEMDAKANKYGSRWREIMTRWAIMRGFPIALPNPK